jgi:hypothetical protein
MFRPTNYLAEADSLAGGNAATAHTAAQFGDDSVVLHVIQPIHSGDFRSRRRAISAMLRLLDSIMSTEISSSVQQARHYDQTCGNFSVVWGTDNWPETAQTNSVDLSPQANYTV